MSVGVSVRDLFSVVNASDVTRWQKSSDLLLSDGTKITKWADKSGNGDHYNNNSTGIYVQTDSAGYRYIQFKNNTEVAFMNSTVARFDIEETMIAVLSTTPLMGSNIFSVLRRISAPVYYDQHIVGFTNQVRTVVTDNIAGSGYAAASFNGLTAINNKVVVSFSRKLTSPSFVRVSMNNQIYTLPATNTAPLSTSIHCLGGGPVIGDTGANVYEKIMINKYLPDADLLHLIKYLGYSNGVKI